MSFEEVADTFRGCADFAQWPRPRSERVIDFVRGLEMVPDVSRLNQLLAEAEAPA